MNIIEMQGVRKHYGKTEALAGLDLSVSGGEIVSFLGPNGAGKSTAINIMLGLRQPTAGMVRLFGQEPTSPKVRARTGVMLQESGVPGSLKVQEIIRLFASAYPYTLPLEDILTRADLKEKSDALISSLSGGQKQRLYFALALVGDPDLIFLDEPTVAMDVESRRLFWEGVREFASLGKTVLFSTHYLEEADAMASRIVVINRGQVIAEGSPREIKRLVAEKTVYLKTDVRLETLRSYPGVQRAEAKDDGILFYASEPELALAKLFRDGQVVRDLSVKDTDLEAAFVSLTKGVQA